MTKKLENFDFEATCRELEAVAKGTPEHENAAVELAAYALHFLYTTDQFVAFREYLREVKEPASREARIERDFKDMAQAVEWLNGALPAFGVHVKVDGKTYEVWRTAEGRPLLVPYIAADQLDE